MYHIWLWLLLVMRAATLRITPTHLSLDARYVAGVDTYQHLQYSQKSCNISDHVEFYVDELSSLHISAPGCDSLGFSGKQLISPIELTAEWRPVVFGNTSVNCTGLNLNGKWIIHRSITATSQSLNLPWPFWGANKTIINEQDTCSELLISHPEPRLAYSPPCPMFNILPGFWTTLDNGGTTYVQRQNLLWKQTTSFAPYKLHAVCHDACALTTATQYDYISDSYSVVNFPLPQGNLVRSYVNYVGNFDLSHAWHPTHYDYIPYHYAFANAFILFNFARHRIPYQSSICTWQHVWHLGTAAAGLGIFFSPCSNELVLLRCEAGVASEARQVVTTQFNMYMVQHVLSITGPNADPSTATHETRNIVVHSNFEFYGPNVPTIINSQEPPGVRQLYSTTRMNNDMAILYPHGNLCTGPTANLTLGRLDPVVGLQFWIF